MNAETRREKLYEVIPLELSGARRVGWRGGSLSRVGAPTLRTPNISPFMEGQLTVLAADDALVNELAACWLSRMPASRDGVEYRNRPGYGCRWHRERRVLDLAELRIIARIVAMRREGCSWYAIAARLLRERVRTPAGREWSVMRCRRAYQAAMERMGESKERTRDDGNARVCDVS